MSKLFAINIDLTIVENSWRWPQNVIHGHSRRITKCTISQNRATHGKLHSWGTLI